MRVDTGFGVGRWARPRPQARDARSRRRRALFAAAAGALLVSGCSAEQLSTGYLPSTPETTNHTDEIIHLWNGSWIAALIVGAVTWGLMFWCMIVYRRRKGETGLPKQIRYHLPLEMMYTIIPVFMVGVLFFFTARDQAMITYTDDVDADYEVQVIGKRWAWDVNYLDAGVYQTTEQVPLDGTDTISEEVPTMFLVAGETVRLHLDSRDVIHSFWVPGFLYKEDMVPGRDNEYVFTPQVEGTYTGKCAELCGEYHSEMLFNVAVVSRAEYDQQMDVFRGRGQTGELEIELGRVDQVDEDSGGEG